VTKDFSTWADDGSLEATLKTIREVTELAKAEGYLVRSSAQDCKIFGKRDPKKPSQPLRPCYGVCLAPHTVGVNAYRRIVPALKHVQILPRQSVEKAFRKYCCFDDKFDKGESAKRIWRITKKYLTEE
jgi:hypothetical protein